METDVDCGGPDCKPCSIPGLVINEVDYNQTSTDTMEFVEILNNTADPIDRTCLRRSTTHMRSTTVVSSRKKFVSNFR